jgi:hypothetical protein
MPGIIPTATVAYGTDSPNQVADIDRTTDMSAAADKHHGTNIHAYRRLGARRVRRGVMTERERSRGTRAKPSADYFGLPRGAWLLGNCAQALLFCAAPSSIGVILAAA